MKVVQFKPRSTFETHLVLSSVEMFGTSVPIVFKRNTWSLTKAERVIDALNKANIPQDIDLEAFRRIMLHEITRELNTSEPIENFRETYEITIGDDRL